jgi:hypothetical protein
MWHFKENEEYDCGWIYISRISNIKQTNQQQLFVGEADFG